MRRCGLAAEPEPRSLAGRVWELLDEHRRVVGAPWRLLLIGAGEVICEAAACASWEGVARPPAVTVASREPGRALALARRLNGEPMATADLAARLAEFDAVVSCSPCPEPLIERASVVGAMRRRPGRPLLLIDLSVPPTVGPGVAHLSGVALHRLDALLRPLHEEALRRQAMSAFMLCASAIKTQVRHIQRGS